MFTIEYRSFYIHGYTYKNECRWTFGGTTYLFKSLLAAKQFITRMLRKAYGYSQMSSQNKRIFKFN